MGVEAAREWKCNWNERLWVPKTNQNLRALTHTHGQTTPRTTPCPAPSQNNQILRTLMHTHSQTTPRTTPCPAARFQNESKSASPYPYTHQTTPRTTPLPNRKNLRTLTPILEVRTPIAKAIWRNRRYLYIYIHINIYIHIYIYIYTYIQVVPGRAGGGSFRRKKN